MAVKEERHTWGELINRESPLHGRVHVCDAVSDSEGDLLNGGASRLSDMVSGDTNGIPIRNTRGAVRKDIRNEPHPRTRRIDIRTPSDVLLEDIVLRSASECGKRNPSALSEHDQERQQGRCRRVDGHRDGHVLKLNPLKEAIHVIEGSDRHPHSPNLSTSEVMIGVTTHLRRKIERDTQSGYPLLKEEVVTRVGLSR